MAKLYDEKSIESLSPLEFTRLRPGVYAGDCTYSTQLLIEIFSNSVDEFNATHGNIINVKIDKDIVTVEDFGQGFIVNSFREDNKTILEAAFSVLNTSGKYREDGSYEGTSLGSFGIGSKIANFLSNWLEVETRRDGKYEHIWFKEGVFDKRESGKWDKESGTMVRWKASKEFFTHPEVEVNKIKTLFKTISCLCPGLTINLDNNGEKTTYYSSKGLNDLVDDYAKNKEIITNRLIVNYNKNKYKLDLVLTYTSNYSSLIVPYVNTGLTDSGAHITQLKTTLTREMNKYFREKGWLKEKEENLTGDDIQEGMYVIFNYTAPSVSYDAQVKSRITSIDTKPLIDGFSEALTIWLKNNEKEVKNIADKAIAARKAREAAKKAKDSVRNTNQKKKSLLNLPTKLVDCWSKNRQDCELLIAEGDSAASGLIGARDGEFQACFPIRGKIINLFKNTDEKVFANQEVVNIIKALGLDLDTKTKKLIYDKNKLRYGKILMCCDADPDGQAIKNLLLTYFWSLCPDLIKNGHIYTTLPPLFRVTTNKNKYIYLKDAKELEEYKEKHKNEKFLVNRNKGLGEQDADELEECLLNPETRNIAQITVNDCAEAARIFEILMGPSVPPRREYILKYSEEANI